VVLDESHVAVPQLHGQYEGDRSRKEILIEHGFRLPSAADNRPLRFDEVMERVNQVVFLSATPGELGAQHSSTGGRADRAPHRPGRPRGHRQAHQGPDRRPHGADQEAGRGDERVLVTTLTKKMAEDLTDYLLEQGVRVRYLHSNIDTVERIEILRTCAWASSTCSSASTCSGRASTCPRCRWWPSSTPTRRGSCAPRPRSSRPWAGPPATSTAR
jgi:excinuclease ABC subunit B